MKRKSRNYLIYNVPRSWCVQDEDVLTLFDPNGTGAMTVSFYNTMGAKEDLENQLRSMAQKYIGDNHIELKTPLIMQGSSKMKFELSGFGVAPDGWFTKFWFVAKHPRIVFATYHSQDGSDELEKYEKVVESFKIRDVK